MRKRSLSDVVWVIRKFQPDVIITRFPPDSRAGHGHHSASAVLAHEAFDAAADPNRFPEQFKYGVKPWQAKRLLWNSFNFGRAEYDQRGSDEDRRRRIQPHPWEELWRAGCGSAGPIIKARVRR
jgi:LmbE family N-acetylglucosaminyl deacetylase